MGIERIAVSRTGSIGGRLAVLGRLLVALAVWGSGSPAPAGATPPGQECASERTERCDARYDPVCASWDADIRCVDAPCPSVEPRLYTNACLACRDERVQGFRYGTCPEPPEPQVGERHRVRLDRLTGRLSQHDRPRVVDVDLDVSAPISVTRAWIRIEGDAVPGSAESLDPVDGVVEIRVELQVALQDSFETHVLDLARPVARLGPRAHGRRSRTADSSSS